MKKCLIPIFFALTTLWPHVCEAITTTTTFTLSVTIPQHAGISATTPESVSRDGSTTPQSALVQSDEAVRDHQVVRLESYVTK
jgi:hypothetical protein